MIRLDCPLSNKDDHLATSSSCSPILWISVAVVVAAVVIVALTRGGGAAGVGSVTDASACDPSTPMRCVRSRATPRCHLVVDSESVGRCRASSGAPERSLFVSGAFPGRRWSSPSVAGAASLCRVREWLIRRAGCRVHGRSRWTTSRPFCLPGLAGAQGCATVSPAPLGVRPQSRAWSRQIAWVRSPARSWCRSASRRNTAV